MKLEDEDRTALVDEYMKKAINAFKYVCQYDFVTTADDASRSFDVEVDGKDIDELVDIISEGMVVQWLKPYVYKQQLLNNVLNTRDFTVYSPAGLLYRVSALYKKAQSDYTQMVREYSYNHGNIGRFHI